MARLSGDTVWLAEPEDSDYSSALDYLDLMWLNGDSDALEMVAALRDTDTVIKKAKDILRASRLEPLPKNDLHVYGNIQKVYKGILLSPVLLVRGDPLIIADGYYRVCAAYYLAEGMEVPCRLVSPRRRNDVRSYSA